MAITVVTLIVKLKLFKLSNLFAIDDHSHCDSTQDHSL